MFTKHVVPFCFLFLSLWTLTGCNRIEQIQISSVPVEAEVWLNGEYLGDTPLEVSIDFREDHKVELLAEDYVRVEYEVNEFLSSQRLAVRLFPQSFSRDLSVSGALSYFDLEGTLVDWLYWDGRYQEDLFDDAEAANIGESLLSERNTSDGLVPYLVLTNLVFANDGSHVAFQEAEYPAPKCFIVPTQLWLTKIEKPGEQELVLEAPGGNIPLCEQSHGFSIDSEWLWVVYEEELGSEEYIFRLIDVDNPLNRQIVLSESSALHAPQWSEDGKWLAFELANGSAGIFHLENNIWVEVDTEISGKPVGWSLENNVVWVLSNSFKGNTQLQAYALDSGELIQEYDLGGIKVEASGLKFSPDGRYFALAYRTEVIQENEGILVEKVLMGNVETEDVLVFEDLDYKLALYWLEDNERIAVLAENESGSSLMKILTFTVGID